MDGILKHIHSTEDIKNLNEKELKQLCKELRRFLLQKVSKTGGHLASNLGIVELNDRALTAMCHMSLPYMHPGSKIINLGSNSAWQPVPYMSVYGASKAYVLSFSRALGRELKGRDIQVLCVCPGWVKTEFMDRAVHDSTVSFFDRWYESEDVVEKAMRDLRKGKTVSILGFPVRMQVRLVKLLPVRMIMNIWCKQQKKP